MLVKTEINGNAYSMQTFRFTESAKLKAKLLRIVAPFFDAGENVEVSKVLPIALENLDISIFDDICKHLSVIVEGKPIPLNTQTMRDSFWSDKQAEAYKAMLWVIWENYKGFFQEVGLSVGDYANKP